MTLIISMPAICRPNRLTRAVFVATTMAVAVMSQPTPGIAQSSSGQSRSGQASIADAVAVVDAFFQAHGQRLNQGRKPLLDQANASADYLVDALAIPDLQGRLGFDPVYGGQDYDISNLRIQPDGDTPLLRGAAQVVVRFKNFGQTQTMHYTLVRVQPHDVWQISDIYSDEQDWSLWERANEIQPIRHSNTAFDQVHPSFLKETAADKGFDAPFDPNTFVNGVIPPTDQEMSDADNEVGMEQGDEAGDGRVVDGNDLLIILDASGSMWGKIDGVAKIVTAKNALADVLANVPSNTNFGLMAYGHRREGDCSDTQILLPVLHWQASVMARTVRAINPRGKTPIAGALSAAVEAFGGPDRPADVLLISDGKETCGGDPCAAARRLAAHGIKTRVHVVGFDLNAQEHKALQCVAEQGNGTYYTADTAKELGQAIKEIATDTAPKESAPVPTPVPPKRETVFEENFDGPALSEDWTIAHPDPRLTRLDQDGALFVAVAGTNNTATHDKARNRYILDQTLPDGDFDISLHVRFEWQTGEEGAWLSVFNDAGNQIVAGIELHTKGCGTVPTLSLYKISREEGEKPQSSGFETSVFEPLKFNTICGGSKNRDYGDAVLQAMAEEGTTLVLQRRGRLVQARLEVQIPVRDGAGMQPLTLETEPLTVLRLKGKPSFLVGHTNAAKERESIFYVDRFAIERPTD